MESIVQDDYSDPWVKRFGSRVAAISSLPANPLFSGNKIFEGYLSYDQRLRLSLARAKATMGAYALNIHDVAAQTQSFLNLHFDPAMSLDTGARTLVTAQTLAASTLVKYVKDHPAVKLLIDDILAFNLIAQYCLSEVSQGLDTINIETTATALPGGGFELHTPHPGAAKLTLPTNSCGIPAVGIVCARLIIKGRDSGVRPFVVPFNDGKAMTPGITAK
ncbi:hypothetical protein FB451DRAFT_1037557 [Mycena latifolia]|nr:hypothetical protein FB451DRAFT_1037557 [Mycena latifolia]